MGLLNILLLACVVGPSVANRPSMSLASYDQFRTVHRSGNRDDAVAYAQRHKLYLARKAEVEAHNAQNKSWTMTINHFADYTQSELDGMLGYKRTERVAGAHSFLQLGSSQLDSIDTASLAKTVDWRSSMNVSNFVHNQGACGSCWAHAAVSALEAHAEITSGVPVKLSTQQIIDCVQNPRECGGQGGCHGATAELAFEHAREFGIAQEDHYHGASDGKDSKCPTNEKKDAPAALQIKSFVRLPENRASFLQQALATKGPVALSIDAGNFFLYHGGVFAGCQPDTIVNHAVLGVGYGNDPASGKDYWLVKNSWGDQWGEEGHFRVERHAKDDDYCGIDTKPQDGVYCKVHPDQITVCGMCGITSDSAYPVMYPKTKLRQHAPKNQIA